jgi:AmiR/NasT family two-component response regulator
LWLSATTPAGEARKIIERSKGILMANQGLSEADAFALIKRKSMDMRKPMAEIAQALVLSDELAKGITR